MKIEAILFSTSQMARAHSLGEVEMNLHVSNTTPKKMECERRERAYLHATTSILPKGKSNFAHPTESLILSKMDYNDIVFYALPLNLIKRLQRVYNAGTGLVLGRHATPKDITKMS